jgi:hypothetical protein
MEAHHERERRAGKATIRRSPGVGGVGDGDDHADADGPA